MERPDTPPDSCLTEEELSTANLEQDLLYNRLLASGMIKYAALVSYPSGQVKTANFEIEEAGIGDIISALQGKTDPIAEKGIQLGDGLPMYVPSKLEQGKAIYGTAVSSPGSAGCIILKTEKYVLLAMYDQESGKSFTAASTLASQVANYMREMGF